VGGFSDIHCEGDHIFYSIFLAGQSFSGTYLGPIDAAFPLQPTGAGLARCLLLILPSLLLASSPGPQHFPGYRFGMPYGFSSILG